MLVSIIIPVYNVAPYIEDCLRSVMRQTYTGPMECLIVDDCGTDESIPVAERLIAEYDGPIRFEILRHDHNRGLSAARNTGMQKAVGDYILFIDSDDEIKEDCLEKMVAVVKMYPEVEMVHGTFDRDGNGIKYPQKIEAFTHTITNRSARDCLYYHHQVTSSAWNKLLKRSFIIDNNLFFKEGVLYEDFPWLFFVFKYIKNVYFLSNITYHYRRRPESIMTGTDIMLSVYHYCINYTDIITHLTPGHEKEEIIFYAHRFSNNCLAKAYYYSKMKDVLHLFLKKAWQLKQYSLCIKMFARYVLGRIKYGRYVQALYFRLRHPARIYKDFARVWRLVQIKVKS